jgi:hypothetical protein
VPRRDVADRHRCAVLAAQHHVPDVLGAAQVAHAAHRQLLGAVAEEAAPHVQVRVLERLVHVVERQVVRQQRERVDLDVELLQEAPERDHVGHPRDLAQQARHVPVELRAELVQIVAIAAQHELEDLAERGRVGGELGHHTRRQVGGGGALRHDRVRAEAVEAVLEGQRHERQPVQALAAEQRHAGGAVQRALQRYGELALHLFRRVARHLRDDRDLQVGDVRVGLDGSLAAGAQTERGESERGRDRRKAPVDAQLDQSREQRPL